MTATPAEIARRALADHLAALPVGQLLSRYAISRDPQAFAGLVHQFGPLVLGACRRVLGPSPDADDAFQAVFLALSRQAGSFRDAKALPAWLHRVSLRVSRKALARLAAQPKPATDSPEPADPADPFAEVTWKDVRRVLDEEIDALPEKYRGPVVLCWLDGLTQDEAAGRLGVSLNTLKRRLDAGRELLRSRLLRRGLAPVLVTAVVATPTGLRAVVPESLKALAVELGIGGAVPAGVAALEVAPTTPTRRAALAALLGVGAAAAGGLAYALTRPPIPPGARPGSGVVVNPVPVPAKEDSEPRPLTTPRVRIVRERGADSLAWSPDGKILATWSHGFGDNITLWDAAAGTELGTLVRGSPNTITAAVAFSPDSRTLASGSAAGRITLWDVATRKQTGPLQGEPDTWNVSTLAWSPDGKTIASGGGFVSLRLWDVASGKEKRRLLEGESGVKSMLFSPDGATLATVDHFGSLLFWDTSTGRWQPPILDEHYRFEEVAAIAWGPNGDTLVVGDREQLWVLDVKTRKLNRSLVYSSGRLQRFSPDGKSIAWESNGISVNDLVTGKRVAIIHGAGDLDDLIFGPDGTSLATCGYAILDGDLSGRRIPGERQAVMIWDLYPGK